MDQHEGMDTSSDEPQLQIAELSSQCDSPENDENKKIKRRESDAKCRANISAGFDLLKEQVYASGSQEKVSKESILQESYMRIKYLEGILVALQQTKGKYDHYQ
ncbi:uncharacterized protein LOC135155438 [Lytechinus pictus]|uniref:uncharacterized protein LOC135155438 n=1 Tax=Lytechinus pictus TaxID=7653 RepID=UPI0030B9ADAE